MIRRLLVVLLLGGLALAGCSRTVAGSAVSDAGDAGAGLDTGALGDSGGSGQPGCPVTAAEVSGAVGKSLPVRSGDQCVFSDGVALVTVIASRGGTDTFAVDISRGQDEKIYGNVKDIDKGSAGIFAVKELEAHAVVISPKITCDVTLSSFEGFDAGRYEQATLAVVDACLAG